MYDHFARCVDVFVGELSGHFTWVIFPSCDWLLLDPPGISEDWSDLKITLERLFYDDL